MKAVATAPDSTEHSLDEQFYQTHSSSDFIPNLYDDQQDYCGYWYEKFTEIFHARG